MITYGHEKFIFEAIEGVLSQKCSHEIELIIADDNSPDKTKEIVEGIIKNHPNGSWIKYTRHEQNKGMMPNFIWALQQAKSEYIALCEGDDYWTDPLKLQKQVDFLVANQDYVMCYHDAFGICEDESIAYESKIKSVGGNKKNDLSNEDLLLCDYVIPTMSVCYRNISTNYPDLFASAKNGDMYLFAFLSQFGKAKQLNNITTSAYRIHKGGVYSLLSDIQKTEGAIETREKIMESFIEEQKVKIKMLQNIKAIEITLLYKLLINKKVRHYFIYLRKLKYNNPFNAVIKSTLLVFKKLLNKMLLCL